MDEVQVQVRFTKTTASGDNFTDALYFSISDYNNLTPADIEAAKTARFEAWQKIITSPPPEVPLEDQITNIDDQIISLTQQKQELQAQVTTEAPAI